MLCGELATSSRMYELRFTRIILVNHAELFLLHIELAQVSNGTKSVQDCVHPRYEAAAAEHELCAGVFVLSVEPSPQTGVERSTHVESSLSRLINSFSEQPIQAEAVALDSQACAT